MARRPPPSAPPDHSADALLAARLQQEEVIAARRMQAAVAAARPQQPPPGEEGEEDLEGRAYIVDPVWGLWVQPGPRGTRPKPLTLCCLGCCPCCVPPCCAPRRRAAWRRVACSASFLLSISQLAVLIASLCLRGFAPFAVNPGLGPWLDTLDFMGAKNAVKVVMGDPVGSVPMQGLQFTGAQPWRLVTCIFLHGGLLHIAVNFSMQLRLGLLAEFVWGKWRYLPVYFGSGVASSLWSCIISPGNISVGASGALMGVLGAWATFLVCHWGHGTEQEQVRELAALFYCTPLYSLFFLIVFPLPLPPPTHTHTFPGQPEAAAVHDDGEHCARDASFLHSLH